MKKKLHIIFLDFDDIKNPLLGAGQARATFEVGSRLAKMGHKVTVICSKYPGCKDRKENGIYYRHTGIGSRYIQLNNAYYILSIPFTVKMLKADIIIECFTAPISTLFTPIFTKIPVIALPSMFNAAEFEKKYNLPFTKIERLGMKFYKYIMPYSEIDCAKAKKLNQNIEFRIVKQGVGDEYFNVRRTNTKHVLFLSRFDIQQKGIDLLLKAFAKVKDKIGAPLVIAGHGPDERKIKKMIQELHLEDSVLIVGSAYGKKKKKLMSEALFVAFPSRHDELSLWALEALAAGLPIVCFDLPEGKWLSSEVSLKAKQFSIKNYAEALLKATDKKINIGMSIKARKFAKQFSWDKVADEFVKFIQYVLKKEEKNVI